jgi:hypothetical protein
VRFLLIVLRSLQLMREAVEEVTGFGGVEFIAGVLSGDEYR